jgi:hypothetical protein
MLGGNGGQHFTRKRSSCLTKQVRKKPRTSIVGPSPSVFSACVSPKPLDARPQKPDKIPTPDVDAEGSGTQNKSINILKIPVSSPSAAFLFSATQPQQPNSTSSSSMASVNREGSTTLKRVREALDYNRSAHTLDFSMRATKGRKQAPQPGGKKRGPEEQLLPSAKTLSLFSSGDVRTSLGSNRLSEYIQRGVIPSSTHERVPSRKRDARVLSEQHDSTCQQQPSAALLGLSLDGGGASSGAGGEASVNPTHERSHVCASVVFPPKVSRLTQQGR